MTANGSAFGPRGYALGKMVTVTRTTQRGLKRVKRKTPWWAWAVLAVVVLAACAYVYQRPSTTGAEWS